MTGRHLVVSGGPRSAANFTVMLPGVTTGGTNNAFDARINGGLQTGQEAIMDGVSMQQGSMSQSGMLPGEPCSGSITLCTTVMSRFHRLC